MSSAVDDVLTKAFALIENDEQREALTILQPILKDNENNADVWWLYAHAVSDAGEAQKALKKVAAIDPTYPGAATLKLSLENRFPEISELGSSGIRPLVEREPLPAIPDTLPDMPGEDADSGQISDDWALDWDQSSEDSNFEDVDTLPAKKRRRWLIPSIIIIVVVVLIVAVIASLGGNTPQAKPTETTVAQALVPTKTLIPTMIVVPTVEAQAAQQDDFTELHGALADFDIPQDGIEVVETSLGNTLSITACEDRSALAEIMDISVREGLAVVSNIEAIGVRIGDCKVESSMRIVGVLAADAIEYIDGNLTQQDFQRLWKPIG